MHGPVKLAAAAALLMGAAAVGMASAATAPPKTLIAPVPDAQTVPPTDASWPFDAAKRNLVPIDLAARGYAETETLVSGKANVYDWGPDGRPVVKSGGNAFGGRILVRAPADKAKFSGVVVVEILNDARAGDWPMMWGYLHDTIIRDGDAWVGVTTPRGSIGLKKFDAQRYAAVTFAPTGPLACKTADDTMEEGLRFDYLAQIGALLKSTGASNPLAGYSVKRVLMTAQAPDITTYAVAMQTNVRLPGGKPIYDGFLIKSPGGLSKLNHCGAAVPVGDPRSIVKGLGVPVIAVVAQGEVVGSYPVRRDDSDDKADPYRLYEVAGAAHLDKYAYTTLPALDDAKKAGNDQGTVDWPFNIRCTPEIQLSEEPLLNSIFDGALHNLAAWSLNGTAPPKASRISVSPDGKTLVTDPYGAGVGGVRSVYVDAPTAAYTMGVPGPGTCRELGRTIAFSWPYMTSLYGSPDGYVAKAMPMVDAMEAQKWVTAEDAAAMRRRIKVAAAPPVLAAK